MLRLRDSGTVKEEFHAIMTASEVKSRDRLKSLGWRFWPDRLFGRRVKVTPSLVQSAIEIAKMLNTPSRPCTVEAAARVYLEYIGAFVLRYGVTQEEMRLFASFGEFSLGIVADVPVNLGQVEKQEAAQLAWQRFFAAHQAALNA